MTRKAFLLAGAAALLGAGAWYAYSDPAPESALATLDSASFATFKEEFNAAAGNVRVIGLLSPT